MNKKLHDFNKLPKWAKDNIATLANEVNRLNSRLTTITQMHTVLSDKDRSWFTLTDPINGCNQEHLHLWILDTDHPYTVCSLNKGDLLFVGRKPNPSLLKETKGEKE